MKSFKFDIATVIVLAITISISTKYVQAEKKPEDKRLIMSYGYNGRYLYDSKFTPSLKLSNHGIVLEYHGFIQFLKSKGLIMPQRSEINIIDKFCSHEEELRKNGFKGIYSEDQRKPLNVGSVESKKYKQYINQNITVDEKNSNLLHYYTFMKIKEHIKFYNEANFNISNCEDKLANEFQSKKSSSTFLGKWLSIGGSSCNCGSKAEKSTQYTLLIENYSSVQKKLKDQFKGDEYSKLQTRVNLKRIFCHYNEIFNSICFTGIYNEDKFNITKRIENSNFPRAINAYINFLFYLDLKLPDKPHNLKNDYVVKVASDVFKSKDKIAIVYEHCKRSIKRKGFTDPIYGEVGVYIEFNDYYTEFLNLIETNSDLKDANGNKTNEFNFINIKLYNTVIPAIPEPQIDLIHFYCHHLKDMKEFGYNGILSHDIEYISNFHGLDAFSTQVKGYIRFLENFKPGIRTVRNALSEYVAYILAEQNRFYF